VRLAHARFGDGGRPLLLLHGFLGSARNLTALARALTGRIPALAVVAPDLTGHGASPPLPPDADLATLARDVLDTSRALGLPEPVAVVGHSLGGRVALKACRLEPARVGGVALLDIAPSARPDAGEVSQLLAVLLDAPEAAATRNVFRAHFRAAGLDAALVEWLLLNLRHDGHAYRWRIDRHALARLHARTVGEDLWAAVEESARGRVRCIRGERSGYVDGADVARLQAAGAPVETIAGAGHFLHAERPAAVLDALVRHLE
jgi:pimeloyl-ACP methyl ester carboxylesterase